MECNCTYIIEILSYLFILQSLTASKMRKFQTLKLSQTKLAGLKTGGLCSGIMSNFGREFFICFRGQNKIEEFFKDILVFALKSCIK